MLHGILVLDSRTGALLYSQRFTSAYGLSSCDQLARDEMRLSAMLFALHLNSEAVGSAETGSGSLLQHRIGSTSLHFCLDGKRQVLLVIAVQASLGERCAGFLASQLLVCFCTCFGPQLDERSTNGTRSLFKRHAFASGLLHVLTQLPSWILQTALSDSSAGSCSDSGFSNGGTLAARSQRAKSSVCALVVCFSAEVCAALQKQGPHCKPQQSAHRQTPKRSWRFKGLCFNRSKPRGAFGACTPIDAALEERPASGSKTKLCCGYLTLFSVQRPLRLSSVAEAPALLFQARSVGNGGSCVAGDHEAVQRFLSEVHAVHQRGTFAPHADAICLNVKPAANEGLVSANESHHVLLVRAPLLVCVSLGFDNGNVERGSEHAAALAADSIHRWLDPLHLSLAFLHSVRPVLEKLRGGGA